MSDAFSELSGDDAPLHTDETFARAHGFDGRVVHGALVVSLLSRVVGTRFPGPRSLWLKCDISFRNPCYAPSVLRFHSIGTQQSEATRSIALAFDITDDRDRQIATAKTRADPMLEGNTHGIEVVSNAAIAGVHLERETPAM